jgi:putative ABC transport system ATP-binding protein
MSPCHDKIILETKNVSRRVAVNGNDKSIVDSVSFRFNSGGVYNLVGPSGAGKTSYLRLLNRLDEPTSGDVLYDGTGISTLKPTDLRKKVSMIFQEPYLFPGTVGDNLDYCYPEGKTEKAGYYLEQVGLKKHYLDSDSSVLSAGEKQRVAIARSLIQAPRVLLLDEPTSALDPTSVDKVEKLILTLVADLCLTAIIVTHNPDQAGRLGGQTLLMVEGRLIEFDETDRVLKNPRTELARKYLNRELD